MTRFGRAQVTAVSVPGPQHARANKPCQDASGAFAEDGIVGLVVSDGHGSPAHQYSDIGARVAVYAALAALRRSGKTLYDRTAELHDDALIKELKEEQRRIEASVRAEWRCAVERTLVPLFSEWDEGEVRLNSFGATLLAALVVRGYGLIIRIGDGEACSAQLGSSEDPDFRRLDASLPNVEKAFSNRTEGLASDVQSRDWVTPEIVRIPGTPSVLVLATDGVSDPYTIADYERSADQSEFARVWGHSLLREIREAGSRYLSSLPARLISIAEQTGDDASIAVAYWPGRVDGTKAPNTEPDS